MMEFFGSRQTVLTYDIIQYLASMVSAAFAHTVAESELPVLDLVAQAGALSREVLKKVNQSAMMLGITFTDVLIEGLSLPEGVERSLDRQTGTNLGGPKSGKLRTLKALRDEGILTQEEFEAEKKKVLES